MTGQVDSSSGVSSLPPFEAIEYEDANHFPVNAKGSDLPHEPTVAERSQTLSHRIFQILSSHYRQMVIFLLSSRIQVTQAMPVGQPPDGNGVQSKPPPSKLYSSGRNRSSFTREFGTDMILFAFVVSVCFTVIVLAKSFRTVWPYLSPLMASSSVIFVILRNDPEVRPEIAWIIFSVWACAIISYMWTRKSRMSSEGFCCYFVLTFITTGLCMYIIATAQDTSLRDGLVTAIPPCAAFSAYACSKLVYFRVVYSPRDSAGQAKQRISVVGSEQVV